MDWYESGQWWLDATKNGSSKWKSSSGRNRTKVYIYPAYGHSEDVDIIKTSSPTPMATTVRSTTTINSTPSDDESLVILPGPEDINDFTDGLYQWSVTLNARMWPPIESGAPKRFLGLPEIVWWGILSGCLIVFFILVFLTFLFCWFLPRRRQKKFDLSQNSAVTRDSTGLSTANSTGVIFPHSAIGVKPWTNLLTNSSSVCNSVQASQYNSPPIHSLTSSSMYRHQYMLNYQQFPSSSSCGVNSNASSFDDCSFQNIPETHKSMWVLNPLYASTSAFSECENYRTRSLPAWGRIKQRPVTTDDIANLYVKMNLSKKRRNRMCRDEAAIIALCRSRSQNLSGIPFEHEGVVVYDERTEL